MTEPLVRRHAALVLCGVTAGMLLLDIHKVSIAIPSIERALSPGPIGIQLVSASYVLCFAITLIPAGRLGDLGRRLQLTYAGLYLYLAASIMCAVAPSATVLISGRALLGVSAGLLMPQMMGMVQQLFEPAERGKAFGTYGMCVSLATALGPSLGGLLLTPALLGWRGVFVMNIPVGIGLLLAAHSILPAVGRSQAGGRRRHDIDILGLVIGTAAVVLVLVPLILTTGRPSDVGTRWLSLGPAVVLGIWFVAQSRRRQLAGRSTVIDVVLLRIASFRNGVLVSLTWFASNPGFLLGMTIYLQEARGFSPLVAGLVMLPASATSVAGAWIGGRLVLRWGRLLTGIGMVCALVSVMATLLLLHLDIGDAAVIAGIAVLQLLAGCGAGLVVSPNHSMSLMDVPPALGSAASAIGQLGQRISNSLGVAFASMAYYSTIYGSGHTLTDAPAGVHLTALDRSTWVACGFLMMALLVIVMDRRRQVRAGPSFPREPLGPLPALRPRRTRERLRTGGG